MASIIGGFDRQFEGFQVQGNLSVHPHGDITYGGNGSIEASGTLFVDCIESYSTNGSICILDNLDVFSNYTFSQSTLPSYNVSNGSLVLLGGISINNTMDAFSVTSGGTLTTNGGASVMKKLYIGDNTYMESNAYISGNLYTSTIYDNDLTNRINIQDSFIVRTDYIESFSTLPSYNSSTGSFVLYGGMSIDTIENATGFTSGGGLTVAGGAAVALDAYINGKSYLNDSVVITPGTELFVDTIFSNTSQSGAITIQDNLSVSEFSTISYSTLPSYNSSTGSFVLYGGMSIDTIENATGFTSGGGLTVAGGAAVALDAYINGKSYLNDSVVITPGTELFVDTIFSNTSQSGAVTIQNNLSVSEFSTISYSTLPSYNSSTGSFVLYGGMSIDNIENATSLTSGGALTVAGGASVEKDFYIGGVLKVYDDAFFNNSNITLDTSSTLLIQNTTDASDFSGGALTVLGGMSLGQSFYVNGSTYLKNGLDNNRKRITNVALPIDGWDAVNKNYLLAQLQTISGGGGDGGECCVVDPTGPTVQITFPLNENVLIPEDIPTFTFDTNVYRSFVSYVYLDGVNGSKHTLFTIKGVYKESEWIINTSFIGDNSGVDFYVRTSPTHAVMQYTNKNLSGPSYILFNTPTFVRVDTTENIERTLSLSPNTSIPEGLSVLYIGSSTIAAQGLAYVAVDNKRAFFIINTVYTENQWKYHTTFIGDETNVRFFINSTNEVGTLTYTNNNSLPATIIWKETKITTTTQQFELELNTLTPIPITQLQMGNLNEKTKHFTISVEVPYENKAALYFIDAILDDNLWKINTRFMGTPLGVNFSAQTVNDVGTLYYTNTNTTQTIIRYTITTPQAFTPLDVSSGGTGVTSLLENAVLRGNGTEGILATSDFIYEDYVVKLSANSSIEIYNDTQPINSTTGMSFTTFGGASIYKDLYVDHVNITPSNGDIVKELEYSAQNNVVSPDDILGFTFDSTKVRAFHALVSVEVICSDKELYSCHDIHGINKESQWVINNRFIGDNTGIIFSVDSGNSQGQLQYTSIDHPNWIQSKIKFRALTTTK